jgi:hypothetical protein
MILIICFIYSLNVNMLRHYKTFYTKLKYVKSKKPNKNQSIFLASQHSRSIVHGLAASNGD